MAKKEILRGIGWGIIGTVIFGVSVSFLGRVGYRADVPLLDITLKNFVLAVFVAPLLEEFLFRVLPIEIIGIFTKRRTVIYLGAFVSSALWGWLHCSCAMMLIALFPIGCIHSWLYRRYGFIIPVVAHTTHNFLPFLVFMFLPHQ